MHTLTHTCINNNCLTMRENSWKCQKRPINLLPEAAFGPGYITVSTSSSSSPLPLPALDAKMLESDAGADSSDASLALTHAHTHADTATPTPTLTANTLDEKPVAVVAVRERKLRVQV